MSKEMNANEKKGFGARFMNWYGSYQGKRVVGMVYSIGASVVIIGALFKIMHFPGAGAVLMVGMIAQNFRSSGGGKHAVCIGVFHSFKFGKQSVVACLSCRFVVIFSVK